MGPGEEANNGRLGVGTEREREKEREGWIRWKEEESRGGETYTEGERGGGGGRWKSRSWTWRTTGMVGHESRQRRPVLLHVITNNSRKRDMTKLRLTANRCRLAQAGNIHRQAVSTGRQSAQEGSRHKQAVSIRLTHLAIAAARVPAGKRRERDCHG